MVTKQDILRATVRRLLADGRVDLVIAYGAGTLPLRTSPVFVRTPEEADLLVWNSFCEYNLANYLPRCKGDRVGIVVKGCDARAVVQLLQENQVQRDRLYIIGIPCAGVIDRRKVAELVGGREITVVEETGDSIVVRGHDFAETLARDAVLYLSCRGCRHPNPVLADLLIGERVAEKEGSFEDITAFESLPAAEREAYFVREMNKCIRCYACRNACPMCYCKQCFVDASNPQWLSKWVGTADNMFFHLGRAFHLVGRCVDCGACARACPVGVDLMKLHRKMVKDARELFGYEAGLDPRALPLLGTFSPNDTESFTVGG